MYRLEFATVGHLPWLRLLFTRWYAEQPYAYPVMDEEEFDRFVVYVARQLATNPLFYCTLAFIGHRAVGFISGQIMERAIGKPHVIFNGQWFYVVPKHRHRGVAQLLLTDMQTWANARNVEQMELGEATQYDDIWKHKGFTPFTTNYTTTFSELLSKFTRRVRRAS